MFKEELTKIRACEEKADTMQKNARMQAKQRLEDVHQEVTSILSKAESEGKEAYQAFIAEGEKEVDAFYQDRIDQANAECERMTRQAKDKTEKAVEAILERIGYQWQ